MDELFVGFECNNPPEIDRAGKTYGSPIQYPDKEDLEWWIGGAPSGRLRFRVTPTSLPEGWSLEDIIGYLEAEEERRGCRWRFNYREWLKNTK